MTGHGHGNAGMPRPCTVVWKQIHSFGKKNTNREKAWLFQHKPNLVATYSTNIQITMGSSI